MKLFQRMSPKPGLRLRALASPGSAMTALLMTVGFCWPAAAVPPDMTLNRIDPFDGTSILVARAAADDPADPGTFQLKADIFFDNGGMFDESVTLVRFEYPGSAIPMRQYTPQSFPSDAPPELWVIPAGDRDRVPVYDGLGRDLPLPVPTTVRISVFFGFDPVPFVIERPLLAHDNAVPLGAYFFPARPEDLEPGHLWSFGTRHTVDAGGGGGTLNPSTRTQRYALDMGVVRWDGAAWTGLEPGADGSQNDDYLVWEMPLYAMHDGTIVSCYRGEVDHDPGSFDDISFENGFGNSLAIRHGDEVIKIAHLRFGHPTSDLCPNAGQNDDLSIPVTAGQFLGLVGNTGRSTNAHIHFQAERAPGIGSGEVTGVPMNFLNVRTLGDPTSRNNLGANPALAALHGSTLHKHSLTLPNPCGWDMPPSGATEVARHGVPDVCYQDVFNLITARDYRPVWVDGYEVAGQTDFNAIFRPAGPPSVARHGLTSTQYQDVFDELTAAGFRLHQVDSYLQNGNPRFAAIFEQRPGNPWAALHGFEEADYSEELDDLAEAGFVPVNLSVVDWNGGLRYTALFEQVQVDGWTVYTVPVADYQSVFDVNVAAGRDPITVEGVSSSPAPLINVVFVDPIGDDWVAAHGLSGPGYQTAWEDNTSAARWTRAVTGYEDAGTSTWAGLWRARPDTVIDSGPDLVTNQTEATFGIRADDPFATFECRLDAAAFQTCPATVDLVLLAEGEHTFATRARDRQSLLDLSPATFEWLVDLTPPTVDLLLPVVNTLTINGVVKPAPVPTTTVVGWATVTATAEDALSGISSVEFEVDGVPVPAAEVSHDPVAMTWSFVFSPSEKGENLYWIEVVATDGAGNEASDALSVLGVKTGKKPK